MFIEQRKYTEANESIVLSFLKSLNVQVYPCGRRRSDLIDKDGQDNTTNDQYHIPFDPEARLNTEFNNRQHISTNGFTQSFINTWDTEKKFFSFAIGGYTFNINLVNYKGTSTETVDTIQTFGEKIANSLKFIDSDTILDNTNCTRIYANIRLEETPLYDRTDGITKYNTWVLRNQSDTPIASNVLDMLKNDATSNSSNATDYYFSGLSFSAKPITRKEKDTNTDKYLAYSSNFREATAEDTRAQYEFSLCILTKTEDGEWHLFEPAKLPHIEHGETEDSLEVGHLNAESIRYKTKPIAVFDIKEVDNTPFYQLHLYKATGTVGESS